MKEHFFKIQQINKKINRIELSRINTKPLHKNVNEYLLTSNQDDNASSHGNAGLFRFVISSTVGAFHSHAGHAQAGQRYDNADNHEGAGCLEGTWFRGQNMVNTIR